MSIEEDDIERANSEMEHAKEEYTGKLKASVSVSQMLK